MIRTAIKVVGVFAGIGAVIPPLWIGIMRVWQASGIPVEAPMELTFLLMRLWPTIVLFWQGIGSWPIDNTVFAIRLGF